MVLFIDQDYVKLENPNKFALKLMTQQLSGANPCF